MVRTLTATIAAYNRYLEFGVKFPNLVWIYLDLGDTFVRLFVKNDISINHEGQSSAFLSTGIFRQTSVFENYFNEQTSYLAEKTTAAPKIWMSDLSTMDFGP